MNERYAAAYVNMKEKQEKEQAERKAMVEHTLDRLGIPRHKEGYQMLEEIILYVWKYPEGLKAFKKQVFPAVFPGVSSKEVYDKCTFAMTYMTKASNALGRKAYVNMTREEISEKNFPTVKKFVENMYSYLCK